MRPHRQQPTRLPRPWDSPGKNTGVGCHFPLQSMKVKSESEVAQSRPTLSDPIDSSPPGSPVPGIFQVRVLQWGRYYRLLRAGRLGISKWRQWAAIITSFLSMSGGNRLKLSDFFPSLYKIKRRFPLKSCCHDDSWFHPNLTFLSPQADQGVFLTEMFFLSYVNEQWIYLRLCLSSSRFQLRLRTDLTNQYVFLWQMFS